MFVFYKLCDIGKTENMVGQTKNKRQIRKLSFPSKFMTFVDKSVIW